MTGTARTFLALAAALGFSSVALGAFGAQALKATFAAAADGADRAAWWQTATHYVGVHALALGLVAALLDRRDATSTVVSGWAFFVGACVFGGTLFTMAITGQRWLGAITPLGGLSLLVGWAALFVTAIRQG